MVASEEDPVADDVSGGMAGPAMSAEGGIAARSHPGAQKDVPISATGMVSEPAPQVKPEKSWEEIYEDRLKRFWAAAHASTEMPDTANTGEEWRVFKEAMMRLGALGALVDVTELPSEEIPGTVADIDLIVARRMDQGMSRSEVVNFIRTSLVATIARLEQRQESTPERRTDVIIKALQPLQDAPQTAALACDLMRYLQTQRPEQRLAGYYDTIDDIGSLVRSGGDKYRLPGVFITHVVLNGMRNLVVDGRIEFTGGALGVVSNSAYRLATLLSSIFNERGEQPDVQAGRVFRDLQAISAATTPLLAIDPAAAAELAHVLGFLPRQPVDFLTALEDMGATGEAWQRTRIGQSRLTAVSGIPAALAEKGAYSVSRMFNAGIFLSMEDQSRPTAGEQLRRGQLLLNTIGLRLAMQFGGDLFTALTQFSGLNCGVNLVGAFALYRPMPDAIGAVRESFLPLIRDFINLTNWPALQDPGIQAESSLARLAGAGKSLKLSPETFPRFDDISLHIEQALDSLRQNMGSPMMDIPLLDSAQLIQKLFSLSPILTPVEEEDLEDLVQSVLQSREYPDRVLIERYAGYAASTENPIGDGPFVHAGTATLEEWHLVARQLLEPLITIVPMLRNFEI